MFTSETRRRSHLGLPSFWAGYRGFMPHLRRKNALNVAKKLELGPQELELCPAGSNPGAREIETMEPRINADERGQDKNRILSAFISVHLRLIRPVFGAAARNTRQAAFAIHYPLSIINCHPCPKCPRMQPRGGGGFKWIR